MHKKWCPPPLNSIKTNFDGAMFDEPNEAGLRVIVHNSAGEVMATLSENIKKPPSVMTLELLAARRAAIFVHESGFHLPSFEGDFEIVINSLRSNGMENSLAGHIIKDAMSYVSLLQSFSFSHVVRQSNAIAHTLAQRTILSFPLQV